MNIYEVNRTHLINTHLASTTPRETVDLLIDRIGYAAAADIVAVMVIAKGESDGRISPNTRKWATGRMEGLTKASLLDAGIYYADDIHPAHLEQIAREIMLGEPKKDTTEYCIVDPLEAAAHDGALFEYFEENEPLDVEYRIGSDLTFRSVCLLMTCGGPRIEIDTDAGAVVMYTADSRKEYYLSPDCIREINAIWEEMYMEVR
ncbi:MAG: hypothetical protein J6S14_11820 [Clostridia bacterium]|nr:hypothetical protein [Clostridia bacterium]